MGYICIIFGLKIVSHLFLYLGYKFGYNFRILGFHIWVQFFPKYGTCRCFTYGYYFFIFGSHIWWHISQISLYRHFTTAVVKSGSGVCSPCWFSITNKFFRVTDFRFNYWVFLRIKWGVTLWQLSNISQWEGGRKSNVHHDHRCYCVTTAVVTRNCGHDVSWLLLMCLIFDLPDVVNVMTRSYAFFMCWFCFFSFFLTRLTLLFFVILTCCFPTFFSTVWATQFAFNLG